MNVLFRGQRVDNGEWVEGNYFQGRQDFYILHKKAPFELDSQGLNAFKPIPIILETVEINLFNQWIKLTELENYKLVKKV